MDRLKAALEALDERIYELEDKIGITNTGRREESKKIAEAIKHSRAREAAILATTQKVAGRLDQAIEHVESILRH
jgi:hypothetical protein